MLRASSGRHLISDLSVNLKRACHHAKGAWRREDDAITFVGTPIFNSERDAVLYLKRRHCMVVYFVNDRRVPHLLLVYSKYSLWAQLWDTGNVSL